MDNNSNQRKSIIYALLAVSFWSTVATSFKLCLAELDILTMLTIASVTSTIVLFAAVQIKGKGLEILKNTPGEFLNSAFLGLINPFLYYLILFKAYSLLPAQIAQPLNMIWPIILAFLSVPLLKQKISARSITALLISFAGVYIISSKGNPFNPGHTNPLGVLLATGSSVFWAFYFIMNIRDKRDEAVKLFLNFFFGSLYLLLMVLATGNYGEISLKGALLAIYIGIFEMGITFLLWLKALSLAKSTTTISNFAYLSPLISLFFINHVLGEHVYITTLAGLLMIIAGILVSNKQNNK
ncbi:MAG TPA: DMT family transporter [Bacteroidales bacterium]|nr:DMT family transporter [Bacteroidales bacterium]